MSIQKALVLDANILIRACLGARVLNLPKKYEASVAFYAPDVCFLDAERHITTIFQRRKLKLSAALEVLEQLTRIVHPVNAESYLQQERTARRRIADRDPTDWPVVASALFLKCPIWTEDQDFFGSGVSTWTTNKVEEYLENVQ